MKIHLKFALALVGIVPLPFSCEEIPEVQKCPDTRYEVVGLEEVQLNGRSTTEDTLVVDALELQLVFSTNKLQTSDLRRTPRTQSFLTPGAHALSCVGPHTEVFVTDINITSTRDFGTPYPAGTDLLPLFSSSYLLSDETGYFIEIVNLSNNISDYKGQTLLSLTALPENAEVHEFSIVITLSDGRNLSTTSGPITFRQ